jgi:hypothetical protein
MQEKRKAPRYKTLLAGKIIYGANRFIMDCAVRDLSGEGAKLTFADALGIPEEFDLDIPQRGQTCRCETRWRRGHQIGVRFRAVWIKQIQVQYAKAG